VIFLKGKSGKSCLKKEQKTFSSTSNARGVQREMRGEALKDCLGALWRGVGERRSIFEFELRKHISQRRQKNESNYIKSFLLRSARSKQKFLKASDLPSSGADYVPSLHNQPKRCIDKLRVEMTPIRGTRCERNDFPFLHPLNQEFNQSVRSTDKRINQAARSESST
jgi:hypothetical protein